VKFCVSALVGVIIKVKKNSNVMLNKRGVVRNLTAFLGDTKLNAPCENEFAINYKQAFYAGRTATAG